jgi:MtaA/CmuA family methyltransferase
VEALTPKERLLRVLSRGETDRPPVICPGGMMNAAVVEVMNRTGHTLPEGHSDARLMAELAGDIQQLTGFENLGIPFCMTVEAEVLGSEIDLGTLACEPKIVKERYPSLSQVKLASPGDLRTAGRIGTVVEAVGRLSDKYPDLPVIGNLTGPISTTASVVDPITFLKELYLDPQNAHRVIGGVSDLLIAYARLMVEQGATAISIEDPTATGEILGPKLFKEYAVPYLNRVIEAIHALHTPVIVHICGNVKRVKALIAQLQADAVSTDSMVNLAELKREFPQLTTMGNLSTFMLQFGSPEKVSKRAAELVREGVDIISPACGLSTSTPLANIKGLTAAVAGEQADAGTLG